ncbi:hypothetical protein AOQ84DRAFT_430569 [Glonium stellatum]|uniref:NACHT domain-containing protein n=1 Tax=Glonium stellatum TaxID=574774 RepID=A0A8E2F5R7_9PEZI|nr:hypothetical protein AOQ84DRAFT_430569 [Glonium stellatum]
MTGNYFFWNAGTEMQKSHQCPSLIENVIPSRWHSTSSLANNVLHTPEPWTRTELFECFDILMQQKALSAKFCFFIDGLDEYDGDHTEIIKTLNKFTASSNVKICLSSRPWNVFEDTYGHIRQKMRLQDLTRNDIKLYVQDELEKDARFITLKSRDSRFQDLVEEIVNKADGVFLWVYLVIRSLKEGITNADTIPTLQKRLRKLPSDLEAYFRHILGQIEDIYWEGTTQAFQMALAALGPLPLWAFSVLDEDSDFAVRCKGQVLTTDTIDGISSHLEKRLNARCRGLLEVKISDREDSIWGCFSNRSVGFLHRTVRDFLRWKQLPEPHQQRYSTSSPALQATCTGLNG